LADRGKANLFLRLNYLTGKQGNKLKMAGKQGNKLKMGWKTSFYLGNKRKMQSPLFYIFKTLLDYSQLRVSMVPHHRAEKEIRD
jgi:hypothetical protein